MKSALLREFDRHERRSSMMMQRLSEPATDTLPTNALLKLLPEESKPATEATKDDDTTMELQQLSSQLRRDLAQLSPMSGKPSMRSSMEETLARMERSVGAVRRRCGQHGHAGAATSLSAHRAGGRVRGGAGGTAGRLDSER